MSLESTPFDGGALYIFLIASRWIPSASPSSPSSPSSSLSSLSSDIRLGAVETLVTLLLWVKRGRLPSPSSFSSSARALARVSSSVEAEVPSSTAISPAGVAWA